MSHSSDQPDILAKKPRGANSRRQARPDFLIHQQLCRGDKVVATALADKLEVNEREKVRDAPGVAAGPEDSRWRRAG